jgi:hypothetical protein
MGKYVPNKIKKLSNQIISSFCYPIAKKIKEEMLNLGNIGDYSHKKLCKKLIEICKKENRLSFIESKKENTSKCIVIWGEWTMIKKSNDVDNAEFDKIGLDLRISINKTDPIHKFFNIIFSRHALERLLERGDIDCKTSYEIKVYFDSIIKRIILRCLQIFEDNVKLKSGLRKGYEVIDDLFLPIVMEIGKNIKELPVILFTVKTAIPNKKNLEKQTKLKESIFDFEELLMTYAKIQIVQT